MFSRWLWNNNGNIHPSLFYCAGVIINHVPIYPGRCFALSFPLSLASVLSMKVKVVRALHYANIDGVASMDYHGQFNGLHNLNIEQSFCTILRYTRWKLLKLYDKLVFAKIRRILTKGRQNNIDNSYQNSS